MTALLIVQHEQRSFRKQGCNFSDVLNAIFQSQENAAALYL